MTAEPNDRTRAADRTADRLGLIFNIQKFSLHDGSGIRTLVFFKGCPLTCRWCSNPEGQAPRPELAFKFDQCIGTDECTRCMQECARGAINRSGDGNVRVDRQLCDDCGECVGACPSRALELFGKYMTVDEIIAVVEEDGGFYARSGGGLTLSGGEPLAQAEFAGALLQTAQERGIDTALETSGHCRWEDLQRVCSHVDQLFFDVKSLNPERHQRDIGVGNEMALSNLSRLSQQFSDLSIVVRTPVIPGFNDSTHDISAIAEFVNRLPGTHRYELLPYHGFGGPKYRQLGREYPLENLEPPPRERMDRLQEITRADRDDREAPVPRP